MGTKLSIIRPALVWAGVPCTEYYAIELVGGLAVDPYGTLGFKAVIA